jgi:hypothetical protein
MNAFLDRLFFRSPDEWSPDENLIRWSRVGPNWTIKDSFEGTFVCGASGSGKTTGPVQLITHAMLRAGYGLFFSCVKGTAPSDADMIRQWVRTTGRENSLVIVGPGCGLGFNLLRSEMAASLDGTDMAANVAAFFLVAAELTGAQNKTGEDSIWLQAVGSLVRHAVVVVYAATGDLNLDDIAAVVTTAPRSVAQVDDPTFRRTSVCFDYLDRAIKRFPGNRNVGLAQTYFCTEFPGWAPETRQSVLFSFGAGCMDLFQRDPLYSMFFSKTNYTADIVLDGAVLVLDFPILENGVVGRIAASLLRLSIQKALERRGRRPSQRPVAIVWDEAQKTILNGDVGFQETARSARCATIVATQNLPAFTQAIGRERAESFIGNLRTKIFAQNHDPATTEYMQRLCGRDDVLRATVSRDHAGRTSISRTATPEEALPTNVTHNLPTGGKTHRGIVGAVLVFGSRRMRSGRPYQRLKIHQTDVGRPWWPLAYRAGVIATSRPAPDFTFLARASVQTPPLAVIRV